MKTLLRIETDTPEKLNLLIRVAREMGITVEDKSFEKNTGAIEADWKNNLHLPGTALTDAQLEELAEEMHNETEFLTLEEAKAITLKNLSA